MSAATSLKLFVLIASVTMALTMKSKFFRLMTSSAGVELCVTDNPTEVLWLLVDMVMKCAVRCVSALYCVAFNFNGLTGKCDLFSCAHPKNYSVIPGCKSYVRPVEGINICLPSDCDDVMRMSGVTTSGVFTIWVNGELPVKVYCSIIVNSGGWTVIQRRQNGSETFNRNWTDYAGGFGQLNGEFWLGNDNIHLLTSSKRYRLRIDLTDWEGNSSYAEYDNFVVNNASDKYKLISLGAYSGNAGDAMSKNYGHIGMNFSTYDEDNENVVYNCAFLLEGGWWYSNCGPASLNGIYITGPKTTQSNYRGLQWGMWRGNNYSVKATEMKIKPF